MSSSERDSSTDGGYDGRTRRRAGSNSGNSWTRVMPSRSPGNFCRPKIETYSGTSSLDTFVAHVKVVMDYYSWSQAETYQNMRCHLREEALIAVSDVHERTWDALEAALRRRFQPVGQDSLHQSRLMGMKKTANQGLAAFASEIRKVGRLAFSDVPETVRERLLADQFVRGVGSHDLSVLMCSRKVQSLDGAVQLAQELDAVTALSADKPNTSKPVVRRVEDKTEENSTQLGRIVTKLEALLAGNEQEPPKVRFRRDQTPADQTRNTADRPSGQDSRSSGTDNRGRQPYRQSGGGQQSTGTNMDRRRSASRDRSASAGKAVECYRCHGYGHVAADCGSKLDYTREGQLRPNSPNGRGVTPRSTVTPQ